MAVAVAMVSLRGERAVCSHAAMKLIAGTVVALVLVACDSGAEVAALREQVAAQETKIAELQARVDAVAQKQELAQDDSLKAALAAIEKLDVSMKAMDDLTTAAVEAGEGSEACPNNRCTISRKLIEGLRADPEAAMKQARVMPSVKDGKTRGFKIFGVRPGSVAKAIGLKNGDLILEVGGKKLGTAEEALAAYNAIPLEGEWKISVERTGAPLELTIVMTE